MMEMKEFFNSLLSKIKILDQSFCDESSAFETKIQQQNEKINHIKLKFFKALSSLGIDPSRIHDDCNIAEIREILPPESFKLGRKSEAAELAELIEYERITLQSLKLKQKKVIQDVADARKSVVNNIEKQFSQVLNEQPLLKGTDVDCFGNAIEFPKALHFGTVALEYKGSRIASFPRMLPFPIKYPLCIKTSKNQKDWVPYFIHRAFQCMPLKNISITAIDPLSLGKSLEDVHVLLKNERPFTGQRILTRADEIEQALNELQSYVEDLIQKVFVSGVKTWWEYNEKNPDYRLSYKILVLFDVPEQLSDKAILSLERIIEHGPECGVLPVFVQDLDRFENSKSSVNNKYTALKTFVENRCVDIDGVYRKYSVIQGLSCLTYSEILEDALNANTRCVVFEALAKNFEKAAVFDGKFESLWHGAKLWGKSAAKDISVNVGWSAGDNLPVEFTLGNMPSHALLGGKTGSGKSNFLHVLIHSLCYNYSPNELQLYLLDYKEGTEFNVYTKPYLPHAALVATESDVEYGIAVLHHLEEELVRRSQMFKEKNAPDYNTYRKENTADVLPRILLIVDEFQKLFDGERKQSQEAAKIINNLLRQGRSFGIHILLSTQTICGLGDVVNGLNFSQLVGNLGCRIALSCSASDSQKLLGGQNSAASLLRSPPEGILNSENGNVSANKRFNIPRADMDTRLDLQQLYNDEAEKLGIRITKRIFNGNVLPPMPSPIDFAKAINKEEKLYLGYSHDIAANPFIVDFESSILVAGADRDLKKGIITAVLNSLSQFAPKEDVLYYSADEESVMHCNEVSFMAEFRDYTWNYDGLSEFVETGKKRYLIVDGFDYAEKLCDVPYSSVLKLDTPAGILYHIADSTKQSNTKLILFVENYKRCFASKKLFELFKLKIGFDMDAAEAETFITGVSGLSQFSGIQKPNKALYINKRQYCLFKPFSVEA